METGKIEILTVYSASNFPLSSMIELGAMIDPWGIDTPPACM